LEKRGADNDIIKGGYSLEGRESITSNRGSEVMIKEAIKSI
jgi:hypothetical protein